MFERLELFHGDATPAHARVYARLSHEEVPGDTRVEIVGSLIGPSCDFAHTLPARIPFVQNRASGGLLAEAIIADPCFWTPELPFLYRAKLELRAGGAPPATINQFVGIRRLGIRGKSLFFDGKRFVLRGVHWESEISNLKSDEPRSAFARESWTGLTVQSPDDDVCDFASRRGILLVADQTHVALSVLVSELRRLARWPAVAIAVAASDADLPVETHDIAPNLLLAQQIDAGEPMNLKPWARLAFAELGDPAEFARKTADCRLPIVALRRITPDYIERSRASCDALQRDLAPYGDFAGYVV
jgi:hypothetical protein